MHVYGGRLERNLAQHWRPPSLGPAHILVDGSSGSVPRLIKSRTRLRMMVSDASPALPWADPKCSWHLDGTAPGTFVPLRLPQTRPASRGSVLIAGVRGLVPVAAGDLAACTWRRRRVVAGRGTARDSEHQRSDGKDQWPAHGDCACERDASQARGRAAGRRTFERDRPA